MTTLDSDHTDSDQFHLLSFVLIVILLPFFDGAEDTATSATLFDYMTEIHDSTGSQLSIDLMYTFAESAFWAAAIFT